ncbi:hypothetical protein [Flavobacterium potami]|nr:hypothetical protein [Flavobacterium potami]
MKAKKTSKMNMEELLKIEKTIKQIVYFLLTITILLFVAILFLF